MYSVYFISRVDDRGDHYSVDEPTTDLGEVLISIGECVRDGGSLDDYYVREEVRDETTGHTFDRYFGIKLALRT
jgi:hypothetical protein